jgi:hypothetical protein
MKKWSIFSEVKTVHPALPCPAGRKRRRAVGIGECVESLEGAFAEWRGYAVTYPTKYKRFRAEFPRSALGGAHATIRSNECLARGHRLPHRFISNVESDTQNLSVCMRCYVSLFCSARCCGRSEGSEATGAGLE